MSQLFRGIVRALVAPFVVASLCWTYSAQARVHALVVGIDNYRALPMLAGAVNDARDVAAVLDGIEGSAVSLLLDADADYASIRQHWFAMVDAAAEGDTLVFSYAGHGSRVPEQVAGSEADGQDDVFVLAGFVPNTPAQKQIIRDNELFEWFKAAESKQVQVLFIADSCHSGTMTRAADNRVGSRRTRQVEIDFMAGLEQELTVELGPTFSSSSNDALPYVTFLSAGLESQQVPEVFIKSLDGDRVSRGALSFAVARALEGEADSDGDQVLTRAELRHYVIENVNVLSERQQTPELSPLAQPQRAVVALGNVGVQVPKVDTSTREALYVTGINSETTTWLNEKVQGLRLVDFHEDADLVLDAANGDLLSPAGDLVARGIDLNNKKEAQARLLGALDKRKALSALQSVTRSQLLATSLLPDSTAHAAETIIHPTFSAQRGQYMVVLNLAGDGTVQFVYPRTDFGDPVRHGDAPWSLELKVADPLGEDHLIGLAFESAQPELIQAFEELDGQRVASRVVAMLLPFAQKGQLQAGYIPMFSVPPSN